MLKLIRVYSCTVASADNVVVAAAAAAADAAAADAAAAWWATEFVTAQVVHYNI